MTTATQPQFLHSYGLVYQDHYLCPVVAPNGFTFQILTAKGEFMSNDTCYPSPQTAVAAGQQFLDRWLFRSILHSMCDELYDQGQINSFQYRCLNHAIGGSHHA